MADILLTDLTNGSLDVNNEWTGTGVFDKLIAAVNKNIEGQYNLGRIKGADYANVYLGSIQSVIAQSMQYVLQEKLQEAQIEQVKINGMAVKAATLDDHGIEITAEDELVRVTNPDSKHTNTIALLQAQVAAELYKEALAKAQVESEEMAVIVKKGQVVQELNGVYDNTTDTWSFSTAAVGGTDAEPTVNMYKMAGGAKVTNPFLMKLYREYQETKIAESTAAGYKADGAYKAYKSLQELFFSLANLGVEANDSAATDMNSSTAANPYARILQSMQTLLNLHMEEWYGDAAPNIQLTA